MRVLRLRRVIEADFRKSDITLFREYMRKDPKVAEQLGEKDVVMFISKGGDQILLVHGFIGVSSLTGKLRLALPTEKIRLDKGGWNWRMWNEYAGQVGIQFEGFKRFREYIEGHV